MSIYLAARGCGRTGFPMYPRTVSIYPNNYRKMHGLPMMRHVHLRKIEKQKIDKIIEEWIKLRISQKQNYYMGIDLANDVDFSSGVEEEIRGRQFYGQKIINQNAVVTINTRTE